MKITNTHNISLPLAVWLLHDDYDHINEPNYISVTALLKSTKQTILSKRVPATDRELDIGAFLASSLGHAIHDSIEKAWRQSGSEAMKKLGYPDRIAENLVVNPTDEQIQDNPALVPVWIEKRAIKEIAGYQLGGKFDMILDGRLFDFKSTSVYAYIKGNKDEDYSLQGSIYRWLNPHLITSDHVYIQFVFTDWQRAMAKRDLSYPQTRVLEYPVALKSLQETENFITTKLKELQRCWNLPEEQLPPCSDKELWRSDPQYKYFANPDKTDGRSTRNFDSMPEAQAFKAEKGGKGVIITKPGEVRACDYCPAFSICKQKDQYYAAG